MLTKSLLFVFLLFGVSSALIEVNFTTPFNTSLSQCTEIANDGTTPWLYFAQQGGIIEAMNVLNTSWNPVIFLDIRDRAFVGADSGLFGLAFHPDYSSNGWFFVFYNTDLQTMTLSRFTATQSNGSPIRIANLTSEVVILKVPLLGENMGGKLAFWNGSLYISTGVDGLNVTKNGLSTLNLNGKVLRIDVNNLDRDGRYSIPMSNPFVNNTNYLPEIWAYGLRNPWKFSFDCATGNLYLADVGIDAQEEINIIRPGLNYGYPIMEGNLCINASNCNMTGLTAPFFAYNHTNTSRTIIGGYVYRSSLYPNLTGYYIFGDFITGNIYALDVDSNSKNFQQLSSRVFPTVATFGQDIYGNIYFTQYAMGVVYKIGDSKELGMRNCMIRNSTSSSTGSSNGNSNGSNGSSNQSSGATTLTTNVPTSRFTFNDENSANNFGFVMIFTLAVFLAFF
jgi:hypothetical protein